VTIGQAFTQLANELTKAFGQSSEGKIFIDALITSLGYLKDNLSEALALVKAFIAVFVVTKSCSRYRSFS